MRCYKCDRCGEMYTDKEEPRVNIDTQKLGITGKDEALLYLSFPFDMCNKCKQEFLDWFRQPQFDAEFDKVLQEARGEKPDPSKSVKMLHVIVTDEDGMDRYICPVCGTVYNLAQPHCKTCHTAFQTPPVQVRNRAQGCYILEEEKESNDEQ